MFHMENVGPPVKPPRKYQVLEMSQSLGNEIKVAFLGPRDNFLTNHIDGIISFYDQRE